MIGYLSADNKWGYYASFKQVSEFYELFSTLLSTLHLWPRREWVPYEFSLCDVNSSKKLKFPVRTRTAPRMKFFCLRRVHWRYVFSSPLHQNIVNWFSLRKCGNTTLSINLFMIPESYWLYTCVVVNYFGVTCCNLDC